MKNSEKPVDIVYLWVDSNDPDWRRKRHTSFNFFLKKNKANLGLYANTEGRFRDNGELRFNLRCLEKFLPNHGHVYIVTDNQRPNWLTESNKVSIIDHHEIIPGKTESIFNSGNIESYVHHIPNLSENFFYLNDDVFFGMPVEPSWWFDNNLKYFYDNKPHEAYKKLSSDFMSPINSSILSSIWLKKKYEGYAHKNVSLAHSPKPYKKSLLMAIENEASDLFRKVRSVNFRSWKNPAILGDFVPRWLEHNQYASIIQETPVYIESGSSEIEIELDLLTKKFGKIPFFCINDTCDDADFMDKRLQLVREKMKSLLPNKSSFEI